MTDTNFQQLIARCEQTHLLIRNTAARTTNRALVIRNFLLGRYIVEFEQNGANRAQYGESLLLELSNGLKISLGKGFSVDNLEWMRRFYIVYSPDKLSTKSEKPSRISTEEHSSVQNNLGQRERIMTATDHYQLSIFHSQFSASAENHLKKMGFAWK